MSDTCADATDARRRLTELQDTYPLPPPWRWNDEDTLLNCAEVGALTLHMVGVVASCDEGRQSAFGAASACDLYPVDRAYFELLERISVIEARRSPARLCVRALDGTELSQRASSRVFPRDLEPARSRLSLSNGVALHSTWGEACAAAVSELIERDRVLRAWQGHCTKTAVATHGIPAATRLQTYYDARGYEFGASDATTQRRVVGLFLFPHTPEHPLVYGFAAARDTRAALARAEAEALQRLAFLWGEPLPDHTPEPAPSPDYHQDYYLYPPNHAHISRWLEGGDAAPPRSRGLYDGERTYFIDLTPEALRGRLCVAKAVSAHARRLRFGVVRAAAVPHPIV